MDRKLSLFLLSVYFDSNLNDLYHASHPWIRRHGRARNIKEVNVNGNVTEE